MNKAFLVLCILLITISCKKKDAQPKVDTELNELFGLMQGSFNSETQAKSDSTYYNISLHMYPIWKEKGKFLYVEQALNSEQNKPYRQRVYEITRLNDSIISSAIYKLPADSLWIGKWKTPLAFDSISKADLTLRNGCEVLLKRLDKNHYKGETGNKTCESTLFGASYASSEVEIKKGQIISWDRGFDSEDKHIWGAKLGGYIFHQIKP